MESRLPLLSDELSQRAAATTDCPHVEQPLSDCYCRSLTRTTIPLAIYYCREFYGECPIYRSNRLGSGNKR